MVCLILAKSTRRPPHTVGSVSCYALSEDFMLHLFALSDTASVAHDEHTYGSIHMAGPLLLTLANEPYAKRPCTGGLAKTPRFTENCLRQLT